ncbi:(Fe-S)-binding protein [Candidatus Woesearchaeota archaeon]|nr:(Fe-S)-binding protein [Candidatus Woesearchaeota archaeon]
MFKRFLDRLTAGNILYFPGCMTSYVLKDLEANYEQVLKQAGIEFIRVKELEYCCGSPVLNAGFKKDFNDLVDKNLDVFKKYGVSKVVTNCPACYSTLSSNFGIRAEHVTQTVWKNINKFKLNRFNEKITYHDPCHLGRYSNVYEEPRNILKALGFEVVEFKLSRENSMCCGGGGNLKSNAPKTASRIAKMRLKDLQTKKVITCCPMCYYQLKENAPEGVEVLELSHVLLENV